MTQRLTLSIADAEGQARAAALLAQLVRENVGFTATDDGAHLVITFNGAY